MQLNKKRNVVKNKEGTIVPSFPKYIVIKKIVGQINNTKYYYEEGQIIELDNETAFHFRFNIKPE